MIKVCTKCLVSKPIQDFYKNLSRCKDCIKENLKNLPEEAKLKIKEQQKKWREDNKEHVNNYSKNRHKETYVRIKQGNKEPVNYKDFPDEKKKLISDRAKLRNNSNLPRYLWSNARARSKSKKMEFNIDIEDIVIPEYCPILGLKLEKNEGSIKSNSISLDRIDSSKGYIKGNIQVISYLANAMKQNADIDTLNKFALWVLSLNKTNQENPENLHSQ